MRRLADLVVYYANNRNAQTVGFAFSFMCTDRKKKKKRVPTSLAYFYFWRASFIFVKFFSLASESHLWNLHWARNSFCANAIFHSIPFFWALQSRSTYTYCVYLCKFISHYIIPPKITIILSKCTSHCLRLSFLTFIPLLCSLSVSLSFLFTHTARALNSHIIAKVVVNEWKISENNNLTNEQTVKLCVCVFVCKMILVPHSANKKMEKKKICVRKIEQAFDT